MGEPGAHRHREHRPPARPTHARHATYHVVRRGETLYSIAWAHGRDWRELARWNGLRPPYTIWPGQRLRVTPPRPRRPARKVRPRREKAVEHSATREAGQIARARGAQAGQTQARQHDRGRAHRAAVRWRWPTTGRVIRRFDPRSPGRKGIAIGGRFGQPVRAAADGRVVYSGSGLVGYGKLIIIKHDETWLSAYGHNSRLRVREGERVRAGQRIADMGRDGKGRALLHFEIRRDGRPVDPLRLLPRR